MQKELVIKQWMWTNGVEGVVPVVFGDDVFHIVTHVVSESTAETRHTSPRLTTEQFQLSTGIYAV